MLRHFVASISLTLLCSVVLVTLWQVVVVLVLSEVLAVLLVMVSLGAGLLARGRPVPISMRCSLERLALALFLHLWVLKVAGGVTRVQVSGSS